MITSVSAELVSWSVLGFPSASTLYQDYKANLLWSLFLTSTAVHALLLITSPVLQAVFKWYRRKTSDSDTPLPYLCAIIGSLLWLRYSICINDVKLILLQSYAVMMQTFFIFAMIFYRTKRYHLIRTVIFTFGSTMALFVVVTRLPPDSGKKLAGICASGAQVLGSFVCPYLIYKAITTQRIDFIPFAPVLFTWIMEAHAIIYSLAIKDVYLLIANTIFFCMDGCLLACFFILETKNPSRAQNCRELKKNGTLGHTKVNVL